MVMVRLEQPMIHCCSFPSLLQKPISPPVSNPVRFKSIVICPFFKTKNNIKNHAAAATHAPTPPQLRPPRPLRPATRRACFAPSNYHACSAPLDARPALPPLMPKVWEGRGASQAERRGAGGVGGRELAAGVRMGGEGEIQIGPCMERDRKATRREGGAREK